MDLPPAPRLAAPGATGNDGRDARDDVVRSEPTRKPRDGHGEKVKRDFARHIDCAASEGMQMKPVRRRGRASPAKQSSDDLDGRVH